MIYVAITKLGYTYYMYILKDKFIYLVKYPSYRFLNKKLSKRIINGMVSNSCNNKSQAGTINDTITINNVEEFIKYIDHLFWDDEDIRGAYKL